MTGVNATSGRSAASRARGVAVGVKISMSFEKSHSRIWPVGRTSMLPKNEESNGALGGPGISDSVVPSHSRNVDGELNTPGLAIIRTLPLGSSAAGPSVMPRPSGKSGPAVQVPVFESKTAAWAAPHALEPVENTVPSGLSTAGPTSNDATSSPPHAAAESQSWVTVLPADDQAPVAGS